jgi:hypothetical protein
MLMPCEFIFAGERNASPERQAQPGYAIAINNSGDKA